MTAQRGKFCPWCNDMVLTSDIEAMLVDAGSRTDKVPAVHGHRLYYVTTGTCVRFMWATTKADLDHTLRTQRNGQGTLPLNARHATYSDLRRVVEASKVLSGELRR